MPLKIFSGIKPPEALISEMSKKQGVEDPSKLGVTSPVTPSSYKPPASPQSGAPLPARRPSAQGVDIAGFGDIPADPPPSYEDAMAEDLAPADGPRSEYEQTGITNDGGLSVDGKRSMSP